MYQRRFAAILGRQGKTGKLRVLDIGCADGRLLDWYREGPQGHRLETHGIELDEGAAESARRRGHRVVTGRFEVDRELEEGSFDVILALHVIEHAGDPEGFARRAAELLSPGGVLMIATPNWDSADARAFRGHWGGNHWPRHWTLYDERSLRALAVKIGLEVDRVEYQPNPIFWVWTCHSWLRARFPHSNWPGRLFPPVGIFSPSPHSFVLLSFFSLIDALQRRITGRTGSIAIQLRRNERQVRAAP